MLKKTIEYTDFNGNERKEDFYFNLTETECLEMEGSIKGGLTAMIEQVCNTDDMPTAIKVFKDFIMKSYGERSLDGKYFMKVNEAGVPLNIAFSQTEAFNKLFMELAMDSKKAVEFFNGVIPQNVPETQKPASIVQFHQ